jgi:hypothetical protein
LHIDTHLLYRKPKKILTALMSTPSVSTRLWNKKEGIQKEPIKASPIKGLQSSFDLSKVPQQTLTQLFNYPLIQKRRVKSTELHYFDHPLIGFLIVIRSYSFDE